MPPRKHGPLANGTGRLLCRDGLYELDQKAEYAIGVDPQVWLTDVLGRIADRMVYRIEELLSWVYFTG